MSRTRGRAPSLSASFRQTMQAETVFGLLTARSIRLGLTGPSAAHIEEGLAIDGVPGTRAGAPRPTEGPRGPSPGASAPVQKEPRVAATNAYGLTFSRAILFMPSTPRSTASVPR